MVVEEEVLTVDSNLDLSLRLKKKKFTDNSTGR